jgi:hypothetical protein
LKKAERSDSTLHHSKFLVRYSAVRCSNYVFHISGAAGRGRPVKSKKKLPLMHCAIIDCGSGLLT